ncbi:MAG: FkbM family methyltransferase [Actinomycetia bacterium]|nr:FkbM family methyltransferase [Actinomycetes bacterium]
MLLRDAVRKGLLHLPPRAELLLRVARSRRRLAGFYEPGQELSALVPRAKLAIDAGANVGLYSYWISRSASEVVAFEPQPVLAKRLAASGIGGLTVHNVALSDTDGVAELHVPRIHGEASLRKLDGPVDTVQVPLTTLDSFKLADVGFLKVDVEGHEEPLLHGAIETLRRSDASVYLEIEERHNPGGLARVHAWFADLGYTDVQYRQHAAMHPFAEFDLNRDQLQQQPRTPAYANNFLFKRPSGP